MMSHMVAPSISLNLEIDLIIKSSHACAGPVPSAVDIKLLELPESRYYPMLVSDPRKSVICLSDVKLIFFLKHSG